MLAPVPDLIRQSLETVASASYIFVLVSINLVGYAVGVGGVSSIFAKIFSQEGIFTLLSTFYFLVVGVCIMNSIKQRRSY
jgi:hypothetical protein